MDSQRDGRLLSATTLTKATVAILGGGPAGLSAALVLGRAGLRTVVIDDGFVRTFAPRHHVSDAVHGFLGHEGVAPAELRTRAWRDLEGLSHVTRLEGTVEALVPDERGFEARLEGRTVRAARVILACGIVDVLPSIEGLAPLYGRSVFSCPHCHGHEHRDRRWGFLARSLAEAKGAPLYRLWAPEVVVFSEERPSTELERDYRARGVRFDDRRVVRLDGRDGALERVWFEGEISMPLRACVVLPGRAATPLVSSLGLAHDDRGALLVDARGETDLGGLYAAGDLTSHRLSALAAAADGARVAMSVAEDLAFHIGT